MDIRSLIKLGLCATLALGVHAHAISADAEDIKRIANPTSMTKEAVTEKLVGTWQCTYQSDDVSYDATLDFKADGKLFSKKTSQMSNKGSSVVHTTRDWAVIDNSGMWILVEQITDTTHLKIDDDVESVAELKAYLDSKPAQESVMSFHTEDGKQTLTRIDGAWGIFLGKCVKS